MRTNLLRSVLFMPGNNQRAMDKALSLPADAIIFDLEDAVAPTQKGAARQQVLAQLRAVDYAPRAVAVRCNALDTPWGRDDLAAIAASPAHIACLPKVESAETIHDVLGLLCAHGRDDMQLWAMVETPRGVAAAREIAAAPGVKALIAGTTDLAAALRLPIDPARQGLQFALSQLVLAARCAGIAALDGVCLDVRDEAALRAVCAQGRALGFDGKTLIHPAQIAIANACFGPTDAEVERAQKLLGAWQAAEREGKAVAVLDGQLIETMHVAEARRVLQLAAAPGDAPR